MYSAGVVIADARNCVCLAKAYATNVYGWFFINKSGESVLNSPNVNFDKHQPWPGELEIPRTQHFQSHGWRPPRDEPDADQ